MAEASTGVSGSEIEAQLEMATRELLRDPERGLRVDPLTRTVWLSHLLAWCGEDFVPDAPVQDLKGRGISPIEAAVLHFIRSYVTPEELALLDEADFSLSYIPYDWRLDGE